MDLVWLFHGCRLDALSSQRVVDPVDPTGLDNQPIEVSVRKAATRTRRRGAKIATFVDLEPAIEASPAAV